MMGIAIRKVSISGGVSEINDSVNVMEFFTSQILPELQDVAHHEQRPVVKAACIKYVVQTSSLLSPCATKLPPSHEFCHSFIMKAF
jgi:hypothetical protein